ncbi:MAG: SprB repeat-containing protein [Janthinobacterium lividum]
MAGERYAKLTLRAGWSWNDSIRGAQTEAVRFRLAGAWVTLRRGGNAGQYVVPDPDDNGLGHDFVKQGLDNLRTVLQQAITQRGLSYSLSAVRELGDDPTNGNVPFDGGPAWPQAEFDVLANVYDDQLDLDFATDSPYGGWLATTVGTIKPVQVAAFPSPATIYNSATGSVQLQATGGTTGQYTYQWADEPTPGQAYRAGLVGPRTYRCTVSDASGASTSIDVAIGSDPRLDVRVITTDSSITLEVSGGRPPYAYQWDDGPTVAARTGLTQGTYNCLITDARGATQRVEVTLVFQPYYWSRNAITLALDAGTDYRLDPTTKPNLSFLCEVWVEKEYLSEVFEQVGTTLEQPADRDGRTVFQVQALLDPFLDYHVPAPDAVGPVQATPLFRRFYLQHAEVYGDPLPIPAPATSLEHHYVLRGGLSFYEAQARTWFSTYQPQVQPFLSWEPTRRAVLSDQPEFLYFLVPAGVTFFRPQLRVHLDDNSELVRELPGTTQARAGEVWCLAVGYQALGLATVAPAGQRVLWWEVWVTAPDEATVLSETRRFLLDPRRFPHRRFLLYATSLGGMATYAALGETQVDAELTGTEAALALGPNYDPLAGDTLVQERTLRPVTKLASGPRTQAQLDTSRDLLLSRRVLLLQGTRWVPGFLKTKTSSVRDENKYVQVQELEFVLPTETLYTPDL